MRGQFSRYTLLGLPLVIGGSSLALTGWLVVGYMPLAALGVAGIFLGAVSFGLGRTLPRLSPEAGQVFLQAGLDNLIILLEELGVSAKAIYLPSPVAGAIGRALIPLHDDFQPTALPRRLRQRLLVRLGQGAGDLGVLVATPGSAAISRYGLPTTNSLDELEGALTLLLVGQLDLASGVKVGGDGGTLRAELFHPTLAPRPHPSDAVLGTPLASLTASVTAEALGRPISVVSEAGNGKRYVIELQVHKKVES